MLITLTQLRVRGKRLSSHDTANAPRHQGVVQLGHIDFPRFGVVEVLELRAPDSVLSGAVITRLFEPRLVSWHGHLMLLRGFESIGNAEDRFGAVQEWRLEMR